MSASPPGWFAAHVVCSALGVMAVCAHAVGGKLLSPPGLLLATLGFLVVRSMAGVRAAIRATV